MRRALYVSAWVAAGLLSLVIVLAGVALVAGGTDTGRAQIERLTERLSAGRVRVEGLGGSFPTAISCTRFQLGDERGVWLTAEHVSLRWSPLALLTRHVQVDAAHAGRVRIERRPVTTRRADKASAIPHIDVKTLSVDVLELGPQLAGAAASLSVHGNAHLRSLQDMSANVVARRADGVGRYELQMRFDARRADAELQLHEPAGGPLGHLLRMPDLGALSITASVKGRLSDARLQLLLDAGAVRGSVQGSVDLSERSANLNYALEASAATPRPGLAWKRLTLHGSLRGTIAAVRADGKLHVEQLQIPGGTQAAALNGNVSVMGGALGLHAVLERMTIPGPEALLFHDAPLKIDASMQLGRATRPLELVATHRLFSLRAHVVTTEQPRAWVNVRLPDLAPFAARLGQEVRGSAVLNGQLTRVNETTRLTLDGNADLARGTANWAGAVGSRARLRLSAALTDQALQVHKLSVTGRALTLSLSGSMARAVTLSSASGRDVDLPAKGAGRVNAHLGLSVTDMSAFSPALAGTLKLTGHTDGDTADGVLTSSLSVRGYPTGSVSADLHARDLLTAPRGTIQAQGTLDGAPLLIDAGLQKEERALNVSIRHADWKSLSVSGDVTSGADLSQARGQLHARWGQLSDLQRLLGMNLQGRLAANLAITPASGSANRPQARLQLDAHDVVAGKLAGNVHLSATGATDALEMHLNAQLPDLRGEPVNVSSKARLNLASRELHLASAKATYHGQSLRLLSPAQLSFEDGFSFTSLKLEAQDAVLELEGRVLPALDLRASVRQIKPSLINSFVPGLLTGGSIDADAQLGGRLAAPRGRVQLNATDMRLVGKEAAAVPPVDVHAVAQLSGDSAQVDARLTSGDASQLSVSGRAPLDPSGALDLKIAGRVNLGMASPLVEAHGWRVAGDLNVDSAITGTPTVPQIGGTFSVGRGELHDYVHGIHLSDITAQMVGSEGMLRVASFTARAAPGNVSMSGTLGVLQPGLPVDLDLVARGAQLANPLITANLNANLHVSGRVRERVDLRGTIDVDRAHIGIPSGLPTDVAVLNVRRSEQPPPPVSDKHRTVGLDISLKAPQQILVQGRGLDAEVGGSLHLGGTTDAPLVNGRFDLQRGSVSLASSELKFTSGSVSFGGTGLQGKIDPTLDFTAEATVTNVTATLKITGLADSPRFELTSTPELPQDEILARLLFGTSAAQLAPLQVAQIGAALATLSGGGSGLNPLARIQKVLGLDRLAFGSGSGAEVPGSTTRQGTSIEAGRYVSDRVYVGGKQSTTGDSQLEVDVNLSKHLKVQTRLGNATATAQGTTPENDPGSSIGLSYQFEY